MEALLLDSLSASSAEHEKRLNELETLLRQLAEQSQKDSSSGISAFENLRKQLSQVSTQLSTLDARLTKWEPFLNELSKQVQESRIESRTLNETYSKAADAFTSMKGQYLNLASEVAQLRRLAGQ
jgi:chromosome segregation ATPase